MEGMVGHPRILELKTPAEVQEEFERIGVSQSGIRIMAPRARFLNVKVEGVKTPAALILKQEMLSGGGECAVHEGVITHQVGQSDLVLMGRRDHFDELIQKISTQDFGLHEIGEGLKKLLSNVFDYQGFLIDCGGRILNLKGRTGVMGVLNVTPDSFSDGGSFLDPSAAIDRAIQMEDEGADIIDIGGESTRPGSKSVSIQEELNRILPVIEGLQGRLTIPISVDTCKAKVVPRALKAGAGMVNDISGLGFDKEMADTVAHHEVPLVIMHIKGIPKNMQENPTYNDVMGEIISYLDERTQQALKAGVSPHKVIVDPGIGFGKMVEDNFTILRRLGELKGLGFPILVGPSRKSFIGITLDLPVEERLEGTAASVAAAVLNGANLVRVHDVKEMVRVVRIADAIKYQS